MQPISAIPYIWTTSTPSSANFSLNGGGNGSAPTKPFLREDMSIFFSFDFSNKILRKDGVPNNLAHHWDYIYEPDSKSVIDNLLVRYIESLVYQGIVENVACEMSARMVAMKSASDNASNLIDELQLIYNKARQASITQELSEIVAGAAAV